MSTKNYKHASILAFLWLLSFTADAQLRFVKEVDNIAALRAVNTRDANKTINVKGYVTPGDGGGGLFVADELSTTAEDGGMVILPNNGIGRFHRQVTGRDYFARWWGPTRTNTTAQKAIDWVSANGNGVVKLDGGQWMVKCDNSSRLMLKSGVILTTEDDSQLVCAPSPTNDWIMVDFALDATNCGVGPARLVGWNLAAPGGDTNKTGVIFSLQDTRDVTIGGVRASNWYSQYADIGSNNQNLQMFDDQWLTGARAFGATGLGYPYDDTKALQSYAHYAERYGGDFYMRATTNGYYFTSVWVTNGIPLRIRGDKTLCTIYYYNPDEGVVPRYSSAFTISADNTSVSGLRFAQLGAYPATETNSQTTGFFIPVNIHLATNVVVENCEFNIPTGKGIINSGSYTKIVNNLFDHCGVTYGNGHRQDWLFYEAAVPFKGATSYSPSSGYIAGNTFVGGSPYKHTLFVSGADDVIIEGNKLLEMNSPNPMSIYTGDEGITDIKGTNITRFSAKIINNTITGTNFGSDGAIVIKMATPTNYVQSGFNPSNMYSAVIVEGNHITGAGPGITLINGKGTVIRGNDIKTASSPLWPLGDSTGLLIEGGHLETTNRGIAGITIPFGDSFYGVANFKNVMFRNVDITSAAGDEVAFRNVEPAFVDNLTVDRCIFHFNGAAGAADYPQVFQWTASTNGLRFSGNDIYIGPSMNGRRTGLMINTNSALKFDRNTTIASSPSVVRRGPYLSGPRVFATDNDVGSLEFQYVGTAIISRNYVVSPTNAFIALEIHNSDFVSVVGNTIETTYTPSSVAASIGASNGTFAANIIKGSSGGALVDFPLGKIYESDNVIINTNLSTAPYPVATSPGTLAHSIHERPISVVSSEAATTPVATFRRSSNVLKLFQDNWFTGSTRDAMLKAEPTVASDLAGLAFFGWNGTTNEFGFGLQGGVPLLFMIGTPSNNVAAKIYSIGTNALMYLDNNFQLAKATMGSGMTFTAGTLASTGGSQTPLLSDINANQFSITNGFGLSLSHTDASDVSITLSNTAANVKYELSTTQARIRTSDPNSSLVFNMAGTNIFTYGLAGLTPGLTGERLGNTSNPFDQIYVATGGALKGINVGGVTIQSGSGSPEGVVGAPVSSIRMQTNGTSTLTWVKKTGVGNTGWVGAPKKYLKFNFPRRIDGTGCTYPNTNDFTLVTFMVPRFSGTAATNANFCRFGVRVPKDIDTSVDVKASLTVRLTGADTSAHIYNVGFASIPNSSISAGTIGNWIKLDVAADASGANDDLESVSDVTLTGWAAGLTANQWWAIQLNRAGDVDASTVASDLFELQIEYQPTQ